MAKAAPQIEYTDEQIQEMLKLSDHVSSTEEMNFGPEVAASESRIKQTSWSPRLIPMWNGDMQYLVPKVHFLQWQREGLTVNKPETEEKVWFSCQVCEKRLAAGAGLPARLLKTEAQRKRAIRVAENLHIIKKHAASAPILLDEKEYNLARQAALN